MVKYSLSFFAAGIFVLNAASCNPLRNYPDPDNFQGFIEQSFTKVSYSPDKNGLKAEWEGGDYITITSTGRDASEDPDENSALFMAMESGEVVNFICMDELEPKAPYMAYYPSAIAYLGLPSEQEYSPDGPKEAPMVAKSPTKYMMFRPICGAIEFKVRSSLGDAVIKNLTLRTEQSLCGGFFVDDSLKATVFGDNSLTLECKDKVTLHGNETKSFWFNVPENSYTGTRLILNTSDGRHEEFKLDGSTPVEVKRAKITTIELK